MRVRDMAYCRTRPFIALMTGATGFIGSHLAKKLVENGWEVHIIIRPSSRVKLLDGILGSLSVHEHDGSTEQMFAIFETVKPDIVFHLASFNKTSHQPQDIVKMLDSNIIFSTQLVEAMLNSGVHCLVNTGTCLQHFENKDYSPTCLYAATKQAFQDMLIYYTETTPLQAVTLKLFNSYGPNDHRPRIISLLQQAAKEKKTLSLSPGEQLLDLVYIDDITDAYMIAADQLLRGKLGKNDVFAISSKKPIRLKDLVQVFETVTGTPMPVQWGGRPYHFREFMIPWDKGNVLPNWEPKITLEEGLRRIISESMEKG